MILEWSMPALGYLMRIDIDYKKETVLKALFPLLASAPISFHWAVDSISLRVF